MNAPLTTEPRAEQRKCPVCRKLVDVKRDLNGINEPTGPLRFAMHAGNQYGRWCKGGGECP